MEWLNIHTSTLDSPEFIRCDPTRRATWLMLTRYCIGQENHGRIVDAKTWGDTTWQQLARVKLREVSAESPLWSWDGVDLVVRFYPSEKEAEVQAKRTGGGYGGKAATEAKAQAARQNGLRGGRPRTQAETQASITQEPKLNPTEGNGREGEGEGKGQASLNAREACPPAAPSPDMFEGMEGGAPPAIDGTVPKGFQDWRFRKLLGINADDSSLGGWEALYRRQGWDEMTKGYIHVMKSKKPGQKCWLNDLLKLEE